MTLRPGPPTEPYQEGDVPAFAEDPAWRCSVVGAP